MLFWKLRVGAEAYYLSQVASGRDDYYSGQGESDGRWVGNAATGSASTARLPVKICAPSRQDSRRELR